MKGTQYKKGDKYMNVIQPFKAKVIKEALLYAFLIGLLVACSVELLAVGVAATIFIVSKSVLNLFTQIILFSLPGTILLGVVAAIPTFIKTKQSRLYELNYRLDNLGLDECVTTMSEYRYDNSYVARVQREDTKNKLQALPLSALKLRISKKIITIIALVLILVILLPLIVQAIPFDQPNSSTNDNTQSEEDQLIDQVIEEIKDKNEQNTNDQDKQDNDNIIEDLENKLDKIRDNNNLTDEEKTQEKNDVIKDAQNHFKDKVQQNQENRTEIADSIRDAVDKSDASNEVKENMRDLANAIEDSNQEQVNEVLDKIQNQLTNSTDQIKDAQDMADIIDEALNNSPKDDLSEALKDFQTDLEHISEKADSNAPQNQIDSMIKDAIDKAKDNINNSLQNDNINQDIADKLDELRGDLIGETNKELDNMIDDLEQIVEDNKNQVSEDIYNDLQDIVNDLKNDINEMQKDPNTSDMEYFGKIEETKDKIEDILNSDKTTENDKNTAQDMYDKMEETQNNIMGIAPQPNEQEPELPSNNKPNENQPLPEIPKDDISNEGNGSNFNSTEYILDEKVYIPEFGMISIRELGELGYLDEQLDLMYEHGDLTEKEYKAIQSYYLSLMPNDSTK